MIPSVSSTVGDNKLGLRAPSGAAIAIIGCASDGDASVVKAFARKEDAQAEYATGELVEAVAYAQDTYGLTTVCSRADTATPGSQDDFVASNGGTSVGTLNEDDDEPDNTYSVVIEFTTGCTVGTRGGAYRVSRDGGLTFGPVTALGTANEVVVAGAGTVDLAAGTIATGATFRWETQGPAFSADSLLDALTALKLTQQKFRYILVCGSLSAAAAQVLDGQLLAMDQRGRYRCALGHVRGPAAEETPAQYLAALAGEMNGVTSRPASLAAGLCRTSSRIDGRAMHVAPAMAVAPLICSVPEEVDVAELQFPLPGVTIRDRRGNPDDHDETVWPGLDDARYLTLRSWEDYEGAYVNNPRLFSPSNSDFLYVQHRRVVNLARFLSRTTLAPLLSKGVLVQRDGSGRIQKGDADAIENVVNQVLRREIDGARKATKTTFALTRTADVLRSGIQPWTVRVIPLAYIKQLPGEVSLSAGEESSPATVLG